MAAHAPAEQPAVACGHEEAMWRGEVTAELRHIHLALCQLHEDLRELRTHVTEQLEDHRAYHARNETRWGPLRWCERHPVQFATLLLGGVATVMLMRAGADWIQVAGLLSTWVH
jgi:hypothetical protein